MRKPSVPLGVRCNDKKILLLGPIKRRNCNSVKARFLDIITRFFYGQTSATFAKYYHDVHYSEVLAKARVDCIVIPPYLLYYLPV